MEIWGLRSSHCRAEETSARRVSGTKYSSPGKAGISGLFSGSSAFSKSSLYIWNFSVHILLKPSLEDFEHELVRMCNCMVVTEEGNPAGLSSCSGGLRPLVELCVEPAGL